MGVAYLTSPRRLCASMSGGADDCLLCNMSSSDCPCCLDKPNTGRTVFPCGHNACDVCTPKLLEQKCPTCKAPFTAQQLVHIHPDKLTGPPYQLFRELLCNTRVKFSIVSWRKPRIS